MKRYQQSKPILKTKLGLAIIAATLILGACGSSDKDKKDNQPNREQETPITDDQTGNGDGEPDSEAKPFYTGYTHYFPLNEEAGPYANIAEDKESATCTDCPETVEGKFGKALKFDGVNNLLTVPYDDSLGWTNESIFSVELWVKRDTPCTEYEVIAGKNDINSSVEWSIGCENGYIISNRTDSENDSKKNRGSEKIDDGQWHHVVYRSLNVFDDLYVDGVQASNDDDGFTIFDGDFIGNQAALTIGGQEGKQNNFNGSIDEIIFYKYYLNEHTIAQRSLAGTPKIENTLSCDSEIRIMPVGDIHTQGDSTTTPAAVSYRPFLYQSLTNAGYNVNFVGSNHDTVDIGFDFDFDADHQGDRTLFTSDIDDNISTYLNDNPADIVLLSVGPHDQDSDEYNPNGNRFYTEGDLDAANNVSSILDKIQQHNEDIITVVALQPESYGINTFILESLQPRISKGEKIILVDMYETTLRIVFSSNNNQFVG